MRKNSEKGQAILLVVLAMGIFLVGALGLAIDGAHLYTHRQMAQAAADAAAQAGILSIFNHTNTGTNNFGSGAFTCTTTDVFTPCAYARKNGFGVAADDIVYVDFPAASAVGLDPASLASGAGAPTPNILRVTITRPVQNGLIRMLGASATTPVRAVAAAAIVDVLAPVPIIVLHPRKAQAFQKHGADTIYIYGGPEKSIQVNSSSPLAVDHDGLGHVDLSHAYDGTGGDFGNHGGSIHYPDPAKLVLGTGGEYREPASIIPDPLINVSPPPKVGPSRSRYGDGTVPRGTGGCPAGLAADCVQFQPGVYSSGIEVKNNFALFQPGIYFIERGGFHLLSNSIGRVAEAPYAYDPATGTGWTNGVMFYNSGSDPKTDFFEIVANSGTVNGNNYPTASAPLGGNKFTGSPFASQYKAILFFEDRSVATTITHSMNGGGGLELIGTIYLTHTADSILASISPSQIDGQYQKFQLSGGAGSNTQLRGQIIIDALEMGGGSDIAMYLNPEETLNVWQVALVR